MIFKRTELLLGVDNLKKLKNSHVIIFGAGGVGGFAIEGLVRAGIGEISHTTSLPLSLGYNRIH